MCLAVGQHFAGLLPAGLRRTAKSAPLPGFPEGLLVVQTADNPRGNQNFKFVSFSEVGRLLGL